MLVHYKVDFASAWERQAEAWRMQLDIFANPPYAGGVKDRSQGSSLRNPGFIRKIDCIPDGCESDW